MKVVHSADEVDAALESAQREAESFLVAASVTWSAT